jgi:RNA polymerase sigma-70 factor (ECF subfamily)
MKQHEFKQLFEKYNDFVYRVCFRYTQDTLEAQDLAQEVFVKVYSKMPAFQTMSQISTWMYRIAVNQCIDLLRTKKRRCELMENSLDPLVLRNLASHEDRTIASVDLEKILCTVKPQLRTILFMSLAEGLSYSEIAEVLGLSKSAVAKSVERFLAKVRKKQGISRHDFVCFLFIVEIFVKHVHILFFENV